MKLLLVSKKHLMKKRANFKEEDNKYYIEFQFEAKRKSNKTKIEFKKFEHKNPIDELNDKINSLQNDYKNLYKEIIDLKKEKNNCDFDIKDKMKEILQDKEIRMSLYKEFEEIMCSKFNLNKEMKKGEKKEKINESNISEFNKKLKNIEEQISIKTNDLINIKSRLDNMNKMEKDFNSKIEKKI